jgi:uncharacterized protein YkwD
MSPGERLCPGVAPCQYPPMRRRLFAVAALALALVLALSPGLTDRQGWTASADVASGSGRLAAERGIRACANRERRTRGIAPLGPSAPLARAARLHARSMARLGFFDHTDPQGRGVDERVAIFDRARRFTYIGENIAAGQGSPASACSSWMGSAGHRANILNPEYTHVGGGFARGGPYSRYYVQVFGAL